MEEYTIVEQCIRGEPGAWEAFIKEYGSLMYSLIHKCLQKRTHFYTEGDVEDILEEVMMALLADDCKLLRDYNDSFSFSTWLGVVTRTQVGRFLRKKKEMASIEEMGERSGSEDRVQILEESELNPASLATSNEEIEILKLAMEKLKHKERMLLTLAYFDERSYEEIAEIMDISINSIGAYLFRIKKKLGKIIHQLGGG